MDNTVDPRQGLIDMDDCVLVVIDMQGKLLDIMHSKESTLENTVKLLRFAEIVGMPVLITEQENLGPSVKEVSSAVKDFGPITKIEFDACKRAEFAGALAELGRKTVIISGIESHICVTQTVLDLLPDHNVHVISDAVASRAPENKEVAIQRMRQAGAVISSTEMVMYEALVRAGTDEFRQVLKLVK
jgi:nicotinamidase-related amidase